MFTLISTLQGEINHALYYGRDKEVYRCNHVNIFDIPGYSFMENILFPRKGKFIRLNSSGGRLHTPVASEMDCIDINFLPVITSLTRACKN
ncbi:hypothetical protein D4L85_30790 [Chryseolinea soli]|uniref:Uncharacterized protein n=1 Tax=Chryseolinea soli TaxID=2321403 RepID=A0A385SUW1_9BACT|nr:hypothetical protein D4L85_30790 [Chryseolinea soli]